MIEEQNILNTIEKNFGEVYVKADVLPKPYEGKESIKAILLGTDPGNLIKGETKMLEYVFGLEDTNLAYFTLCHPIFNKH